MRPLTFVKYISCDLHHIPVREKICPQPLAELRKGRTLAVSPTPGLFRER